MHANLIVQRFIIGRKFIVKEVKVLSEKLSHFLITFLHAMEFLDKIRKEFYTSV